MPENDSQGPSASSVLDDLDREILARLAEDGRQPYRQIARELGVSEGTIRSRTGRMEELGILRVVAIADPTKLGYSVLAFLLIKVRPGTAPAVVKEMVPWPEVTYISDCVGLADIYAQVVCHDNDHLHSLLNDRLGAIDGITEVSTGIELKMHKVSYNYS